MIKIGRPVLTGALRFIHLNRRFCNSIVSVQHGSSLENWTTVKLRRDPEWSQIPNIHPNQTDVENLLHCLESDQQFESEYILLRAPYFSTLTGMDDRFLGVLERWWALAWPIMQTEKKTKPTSTVFHLGLLNQKHGGAVVRILGTGSIGDLLALSSKVDFCTLSDRLDVLSYLTGIRDLIRDPNTDRVIHSNIKPDSVALLNNIENYLRVKSSQRKRKHKATGGVLDKNDWIFMINRECFSMLDKLRELDFDSAISSEHGRNVVYLLCKLAKKGFEYRIQQRWIPKCEKGTIRFYLSRYAVAWLRWGLDPDKFVPGSWRRWYIVQGVLKYDSDSSVAPDPIWTILWDLDYLSYFPQVAEKFHKDGYFRLVITDWMEDWEKCFEYVCQQEISDLKISSSDRFYYLADTIYAWGRYWKYCSQSGISLAENGMESIFWSLADRMISLPDKHQIRWLALMRFLTGLRDFHISTSTKSGYSPDLKEKLGLYLKEYFTGHLENENSESSGPWPSYDLSLCMVILPNLELLPNDQLWPILLRLFEKRFSIEYSALLENKVNFLRTAGRFADACVSCGSRKYQPNERTWRDLFWGSKRFLDQVEPYGLNADGDSSLSGEEKVTMRDYQYFLSVLLHVTRRFERVDEFDRLKSIWEQRMNQIEGVIGPRSAFCLVGNMRVLYRQHCVQFDEKLVKMMTDRAKPYLERIRQSKGQ